MLTVSVASKPRRCQSEPFGSLSLPAVPPLSAGADQPLQPLAVHGLNASGSILQSSCSCVSFTLCGKTKALFFECPQSSAATCRSFIISWTVLLFFLLNALSKIFRFLLRPIVTHHFHWSVSWSHDLIRHVHRRVDVHMCLHDSAVIFLDTALCQNLSAIVGRFLQVQLLPSASGSMRTMFGFGAVPPAMTTQRERIEFFSLCKAQRSVAAPHQH